MCELSHVSHFASPPLVCTPRWSCSIYVGSLCDLANAMEVEARKLEKEGGSKGNRKRKARSGSSSSSNQNSNNKNNNNGNSNSNNSTCGKSNQSTSEASSASEAPRFDPGASAGTSEEKATRLLRVLVIAFNAFLRPARLPGKTYSTR